MRIATATALILGAAFAAGTAGTAVAAGNDTDFPTLARVEFVLGCMNQRGGQNYNTLYGCVCQIDALREQFSYDEYTEAEVYRQLRSSPGERGGVFRDPDQADRLRERLVATLETSTQRCFGE